MKFRMFTLKGSKVKIAVNIDHVLNVIQNGEEATIQMRDGEDFEVCESFDIVLSRLNTIAE